MNEVWVAETWNAHGEGCGVHGVFDSREAAFESLKALPNMTVYVDAAGFVAGRPAKERQPAWSVRGRSYVPEQWAQARPYPVRGRSAG